jgi:hypothetical protein
VYVHPATTTGLDHKEMRVNTSEIIKQTDHSAFGREFLRMYLDRGLGSMSKRDIDILVLHLLEEHAALDMKSNHELSIAFRLTASRVRGLRYESKLRYPSEEKKFLERQLLFVLAKAQYEVDGKRVVFIVEDSFIRIALQAHLKQIGAFADTSFNTELVKVTIDQLSPVLEGFYGKNLARQFTKDMKKAVNKEEFAEVRKAFVLGAVEVLGGVVPVAIKAALGIV